jgi:glutamate formiminotransferase / 5-formyltetrahydrofolate cyclo-ligase
MTPAPLPLLAVPNVSEGRDRHSIEKIASAFAADGAARLLDVHADPDHHRAVVSLAGRPGNLAGALVQGAAAAVRHIDIGTGGELDLAAPGADTDDRRDRWAARQHPYVGVLDVVPVVYLEASLRGAACAEALVVAHRIGTEVGVPVLLYGELAGGRTRAELRRGGLAGLAERIGRGELLPDFGPPAPRAGAGVTLVAARPPLVAFNLELAPPAGVQDARRIASLIREGGAEGLPGLRAIGIELRRAEGPVGQVSMNVERPAEVPLAEVVAVVARHARLSCAELVGLAPRAALEGFPQELPMPGFDPARHVIENALA